MSTGKRLDTGKMIKIIMGCTLLSYFKLYASMVSFFSRWFEETCHNSTVKVLIRILRDMRQRYSGLQALSTWLLDILAHFAVMNNPNRQALSINVAFRRALALMAAGMYLPGYAGTHMRGHSLTYEEQDTATATAQMLLRVLAQGGYKVVLGLETCKGSKSGLF